MQKLRDILVSLAVPVTIVGILAAAIIFWPESSGGTPTPIYQPTRFATLSPNYCGVPCQVEQDKQYDAYREGYEQGLQDATCATPRPGRYLPIGQDCAND